MSDAGCVVKAAVVRHRRSAVTRRNEPLDGFVATPVCVNDDNVTTGHEDGGQGSFGDGEGPIHDLSLGVRKGRL